MSLTETFSDTENKLVVTSRERGGMRSKMGVGDSGSKSYCV